MFYIVIFIAFSSLLTLIFAYCALLAFVNRGRMKLTAVQKFATIAFVSSLMPTGVGLWYASKLSFYGVLFDVPRRFETFQAILVDWYILFLFAAPVFLALFLFSSNKHRTIALWCGSAALVAETAVLLSTLLI